MDYSKLRYRIDKVRKGESITDKYPQLKTILDQSDRLCTKLQSEVTSEDTHDAYAYPEGISEDFMLRYIVLMYTPESDIRKIPDTNTRKTEALKELGVKPNDEGKYEIGYDDVLMCRSGRFRIIMEMFLRYHYNALWRQICNAEEDLFYMSVRPIPDDYGEAVKRANLRSQLVGELEIAMEEYLQGERSVTVQAEILTFVAQDNLGISPESYMNFAPRPVMPHKATGDKMYPDVTP